MGLQVDVLQVLFFFTFLLSVWLMVGSRAEAFGVMMRGYYFFFWGEGGSGESFSLVDRSWWLWVFYVFVTSVTGIQYIQLALTFSIAVSA